MISFKYRYISVVLVLLSSCSNDDFSDEYTNGTLLSEVRVGNEVYYRYTYTEADIILEEKSKFHYSKYQYNSNNQLIISEHYWDESIASSSSNVIQQAIERKDWVTPENTEKDSHNNFQYNSDGKLIKRITHRENMGDESVDQFSYNSQNQIAKRIWYRGNKESGYDLYFYDNKGNLNKQQRYYILENGEHQLQTTTEYEFDNKNNPYFSLRSLLIPGQNTNVNNIVKETYTLHFEVDKFIQPVQIKEYSYEYNSMDYPVKRSDGWEFIYN